MYTRLILLTTLMAMFLFSMPGSAAAFLNQQWSPTGLLSIRHYDHRAGEYYEVLDNQGEIVTVTARRVMVGDEIILPDGRHYRVRKIAGRKATAQLLGRDKYYLSWQHYFDQAAVLATTDSWRHKPVGIYHTHTDESYQPTSGTHAEPYEGDIYQVGKQMQQSLEDKGVNVVYYHTPHDPHDSGAYVRSRRTAYGILKNDPAALFDIHRDGVPDPSHYRVNVAGEQVAKVRIVIGGQNPHRQANTDFAKRIMAYVNKLYPGLIKDIYIGRGSYNQDLLSTALLLEVGTHTNTLEECQRGVALFSSALPDLLGLGAHPQAGVAEGTVKENSRSGWSTVAWLLVITVTASAVFVLIGTGNFKNSVQAVKRTVREMLLMKHKLGQQWYAKPNFKKRRNDEGE